MKRNIGTLLLSTAIIISVAIASNAFINRNRKANTIQVTGLGKIDFTSDLIVWSGSFSRKNFDLKAAYADLDRDRKIITDYLGAKGISPEMLVYSSVDIDKEFDYSYDREGRSQSTFTGYRLTQRIEIESKEVDKIEQTGREITELINQGVEIYSQNPLYYYTGLSDLKIKMIAAATEDARIRAEQIAAQSGAELGSLMNAQMGIFQIIGQNSSEDYSWGGTFNTSSKMKTATITMKLQFGIQ